MVDILIRPNQVRVVAGNLRQRAKTIQQCMEAVDGIIMGLPAGFEGYRSQDLIRRYRKIRNQLLSSSKLITFYSDKLDSIADRFEQADRKLNAQTQILPLDRISEIFNNWDGFWKIPGPWPWLRRKPDWGVIPWPHFPPRFPIIRIPELWPPKLPIIGGLFPKIPLPDWIRGKDPEWVPLEPEKPAPETGGDNSSGTTTPSETPPSTDQPVSNPASPNLNPQKSIDTINALDVTHNSKYQPKGKDTYCNIFASDYAEAMGAPIPKQLDWNGDGKIDRYLNANLMVEWLKGDFKEGGSAVKQGPDLGWQSVSADDAARYASQGNVVVAGWINPAGTWTAGHMAVVRPNSTPGNIHIAQAGGHNAVDEPISSGFGDRQVEYFVYNPNKTASM